MQFYSKIYVGHMQFPKLYSSQNAFDFTAKKLALAKLCTSQVNPHDYH